ncbi:MAG TPA: MBL fold metallo-hydrolase [Candidatus Paceibacterota bacterium]|nr:MBL fold metallo-hydrolase [Candidatus Paceibacterota bacterium]
MWKKKSLLLLIVFAFVANIVVWGAVFAAKSPRELTVAFLNVGQGDAIFIEAPDGNQMLVDAGPNGSVLRGLGKEMSFFDRYIDVAVATHPDGDHISGMLDVLPRYQVGLALISGAHADTDLDDEFADLRKKEGVKTLEARSGMTVDLGSGVIFEIISPSSDTSNMKTNYASIVGKLTYGSTSFMLTGDAPAEVEQTLVDRYGSKLHADILKAGHHGSKTSTSNIFLTAVDPEYTVISVGLHNPYGHPAPETVNRILESGSKILYTYSNPVGVVFQSDGNHIFLEKS